MEFEQVFEARASRRAFIRRAATAAGGVAAFGLVDATGAFAGARGRDPRPIPGGFNGSFELVPSDPLVHVLPPAVGLEMSTITDFNGVLAAAEIQGTAHGTDGSTYTFDADMRFMQGRYVALDGRLVEGTFGFI
ncbi:MAG TPA: hypothetical protein VGC78_03585 [Gaiellaceae bacterium]|jgi:hypothetical protein